MLYRAYSVSFVCMEICIGCIGFVCERKLKKQSQKKLGSRPPFKFMVAKPRKNTQKNNSRGLCFAKMPVSQMLKVWTVPRTRQGLCSHLAYLWATSDFAPRYKAVGTPQAAGVM